MNTLYRFFDAEDTLLYVGLSVNPGRRMEKHKATQPWWADVARIEMEQHPDMATLRAAEREAIEAEKPLHNVRMNGRPPVAGTLIWICDMCQKPVADGDGYITVSYAQIQAFARGVAEWEAAHPPNGPLDFRSLSDWNDYPERARWQVLHRSCDPNVDSDDYWYSIERCRTYPDFLERTAHLFHKPWIQSTTWQTILRRAAA